MRQIQRITRQADNAARAVALQSTAALDFSRRVLGRDGGSELRLQLAVVWEAVQRLAITAAAALRRRGDSEVTR